TLFATFPVLRLYRRELAELLSPVPNPLRLPAGLMLVGISIAMPSIILCWLLTHALFWFMTRRGREKQDVRSIAIDAERFRWLATWAAETGNQRFKRRMLKKETAYAFASAPPTGNVA